jgi:hypothetical protein
MTLMAATGIAVPCAVSSRPALPRSRSSSDPLATNRALVKRMVDNLAPGNVNSTLAGNALNVDPILRSSCPRRPSGRTWTS